MKLARELAALVLFGISFGYVEASIVVYLGTLYGPLREKAYGAEYRDEVLPPLTMRHLEEAGPEHVRNLQIEVGREFMTLVMLATAGLAIGRNLPQWMAGFVIAFGVWDIFYYVFLRLLVGWPASLGTWDLLFLLPVPWVGPVISPVIVSLTMIFAGVVVLWREQRGRPIRAGWHHWLLIVAGGLVIIAAFCWDFRNSVAGRWPNPFNWPLFWLGEAIGLGGFVWAWRRSNDQCLMTNV